MSRKPDPRPIWQQRRDALAAAHAGMIREGSEEGYPTTRFDRERRRWYHLDRAGERVYHDAPQGVEFDEQGLVVRPKPLEEAAAEEGVEE